MMAVAGGFTAGRTDKRGTTTWKTSKGSADADLLPDLEIMRERTRDLSRNSPIASGAVAGVVNSVVGTGLMMQSQIDAETLGLDAMAVTETQKLIEREFKLWADNPNCDITRTLDFYGLTELAFRATLESGDCFALLPMTKFQGDIYSTKIQLIEGDRISQPSGQKETNVFSGGIQRDPGGAPLKYWIMTGHPGDLSATKAEWKPYDAFGAKTGRRNVLHLFKKIRPGQTRGIPYLAPVVETLKQLDRYTEAEIMAAVVAGMFSVFVKTDSGLSLADMSTGTAPAAGTMQTNLKNGAIIDLGPNESIEVANPGRPNTAFGEFIRDVSSQVAMGLELPYEVVFKRFNSSYSASRAALLEAWRFYLNRRTWLVMAFCQPIFEAVMDEAVALGRIPLNGYFQDPVIRRAYLGTNWIGDSPGQLDPTKEAEAAQKRMELCLSTHAEECAALTGGDWEAKFPKLAREAQMIKDAGLGVQVAPVTAPVPGGSSEAVPPDSGTEAPAEPDSTQPATPTPQEEGNARIAELSQAIMILATRENPAPNVSVTYPETTFNPAPINIESPVVNVHPSPVSVTLPPINLTLTVESPKGSKTKHIELVPGPDGEPSGYTVTED